MYKNSLVKFIAIGAIIALLLFVVMYVTRTPGNPRPTTNPEPEGENTGEQESPSCPECPKCPPKTSCPSCPSLTCPSSTCPSVPAGPYSYFSNVPLAFSRALELDSYLRSRGTTHPVGNICYHPSKALYWYRKGMDPNVKKICEIGLGGGHSAVFFLTANPQATLLTFTLSNPESNHGAEFIQKMFPGRFEIIYGNSLEEVPKFIQSHPQYKCDLISVDGSHEPEQVKRDIANVIPLAASKNTFIIIDDIQAAYDGMVAEKKIRPWECIFAERRADLNFSKELPADQPVYYNPVFCVGLPPE